MNASRDEHERECEPMNVNTNMRKPKFLRDGDEWMLAENIPDSDLFFFQIPFSCFTSDSSYRFIKNYTKVIAEFRRFAMSFYFGRRDSFAVAESILEALRQRPAFGTQLNRPIVAWSDKLIAFARQTAKLPLSTFTKGQLWQLYDQHDRVHTKLYTYGWIPVALDMFHNNFTDALKSCLASVRHHQADVERAFVLLTTPTANSIIARERHELFALYRRYRRAKGQLTPKLRQGLQRHHERWGHLGYIYAGNAEPFSVGYYVRQLKDLANDRVRAATEMNREARRARVIRSRQAAWYRRHKVTRLYRRLFAVAQDFTLTKLYRRHAQLFALSRLHPTLLTEIARRLRVSRFHVQFMLRDEVRAALLGGVVNRRQLTRRLRHCVYYTERGFERVYVGQAAARFGRQLKTTVQVAASELKGQPACAGYARGKVKIIIRAKDMVKMKKGDIMVSIATDPDVVPAMKMAGAIVTEQGGITSHAAIVSRELGVPCVIGTKIATKVFKDGDRVEVDATKGVVRKLSR